ncbi:MAG: hypothetical protein K8Q99_02095 [Acholeplasmataceae bacterium]|nr:hypothetical protein [Acholeplasmataceae bacterium]MCD4826557.1 hypothetical protein [Acholeplasmataceae bacterium]
MPWGLFNWIADNWQLVIIFFLLLFILGMTGIITKSIRRAKDGLKETFNPLGFLVFCIIIYFIFLFIRDLGVI